MKQVNTGRLLKSMVLSVGAILLTTGAWAQNINLSLKNVTVMQVVEQLQKDYNYSFSIPANDVDVNKVVSVVAVNANIDDVMKQAFANQAVEYAVKGNVITVTKRQQNYPPQSQIADFKGVVLDEENNPVLGATVLITGPNLNTGIISGLDGTFSFKTSAKKFTVEVSYIGYKTFKADITNPSEFLTVKLLSDATRMEDVVIIGYGSQRRELVTNAISSFKPDEDNSRTALSPSELLQGRVAGMTVQTQSGNLGTAERVAIRGSASLNASNEPLYVVDGIPLNNESGSLYSYGEDLSSLSVLNLTDIESIDVLKDAASAAIYGSRATNGVILITTKQGREGRSDAKVNYSFGLREFPRPDRIDYATSESWIDVYNTAITNYNNQMGYTPHSAGFVKQIMNPFQGMPDTDWLDVITRTGRFHNIDASFSGGNKNTSFYIGANYANEEGIIISNDINKINLKSNLTHKMNSWLSVGANVSGNYLHTNRVPGANLGSNIMARTVEQRPFDRPYKPNGNYFVGGTDELSRHNTVQMTNESTSYVSNYRFLGAYWANVKLTDKLQVKASYSNDVGYTLDYLYYNANHPYCEDNGRIIEKNRLLMSNLFETVATYEDQIFGMDLNAMVGHSFQKTSSRSNSIDAQNFPSPGYDMVGSAAVMAGISGNLSEYAIESYFGRVGLSYEDKYITNFTLRADGSSRFAPEHRWGWFPSMSFGWNVSNEEFWGSSNTELKLRASYGKTGNQDGINNYAWQPLISSGSNYDGQSGIAVSNNGNPNLTWETADQYDFGFDLSFLKGRINIVFDLYLKNTNNLLYSMPTASTTGFTSVLSNIGSMRNKGIELTIDTHHDLGPVHWSSSFNITHNQNELTKLLNKEIISLNDYHALQVGQEVGAFYLYQFDGIYQYDGEVPQSQYDLGVRAGDVKYHDFDNNGIINDKDRVICGSANPIVSGGWSNTFDYKGFSLGIFFTYSYGGEVYAAWLRGPTRLGNYQAVLQEWADHYWTGPGSTNSYPRPIYSLHAQNVKDSTYYLQDGSYIRLNSVSLGYNLPKEVVKNWGISSMRFYVQAENLWLLSHYRGWDPEVSTSTDPSLIGVDSYGVPRPTTAKLGVNVTF